jgi:hypothetical protein
MGASDKAGSAPRRPLPLLTTRAKGHNRRASSPAFVSRFANFPLHFAVIWRRKEVCDAVDGWKTGTWLPLTREEQRHEH